MHYLSRFILPETHRVLLVKRAARVKVMHGQATLINDDLPVSYVRNGLLSRASRVVDSPKLRVARAARLHMRRVDGRVVAVQAANARPVVRLVDRHRRLLRAHLGVVFREG